MTWVDKEMYLNVNENIYKELVLQERMQCPIL